MTNETKQTIIEALYGATKKANTLSSIEEKRNFFKNYFISIQSFLPLNETIDIESQEFEELISDNFLNIKPEAPKVFEDEGFVPWLNDQKPNITWDFYNRYERYLLTRKGWKPTVISELNQCSDIILDHLANPKSTKYFNKKGLVIGDIQSGKTANYTALINKAIDAGYKIVIVLAGMTRDLRNQTQKRLDAEVLGYETKTEGKGKTIGVGEFKSLNIEGLTYSDSPKDFGDMKKYFSTHTLDQNLNPIVAIVKKQTSVLTHLHNFLSKSQAYCYTNDKLDIPILIIDDEVDQASVDTKNAQTLEEASAINKKIRTILDGLNRYSYVGYTATPFANVFIDPDKQDLYPKDFILTIPSSNDYCGIKEYFGVNAIDEDDYSSDHSNDLFVNIKDYGELFNNAKRIDAGSVTEALNNSIKDAIKSFIIAASIKKARGFEGYNSMLIHIARYKNPATTLKPLINKHLGDLYTRLKYDSRNTIKDFEYFWVKNFKPVSEIRLENDFVDTWEKIEPFLLPTIESSMNNLLVLNGDSGDILDYSVSKTGDYIVIGGDKLSRGLTLEGLVVSYYYRNSKMYDSLLQMGRWFGYRKGWIDVCRVFTTVRFMNDFITVGKVLQKFKTDIDEMYKQKLNPREVGQRIMYSPNLIPTARNKMKSVSKIKISFSGEIQQVISFDRKNIAYNFELTKDFLNKIGPGEVRQNNKVVFKNVPVNLILEYLKAYKECTAYSGYGHISVVNWANYIENLNSKGELKNWTVVLSSLSNEKEGNKLTINNYTIYKHGRNLRDDVKNDGDSSSFKYYTIKTNNDPSDFREFFDPSSKEYQEITAYDSTRTYPGWNENTGLMSIYIIDLFEKKLTNKFNSKKNAYIATRGQKILDAENACAPAIRFPVTKDYESSGTVYFVNKDYLEHEKQQEQSDNQEFGGEDNV